MPVALAYDLSAPFYDGWSWQSFWREHEFPWVRETLARFGRGRSAALKLLDVGCGTGWYLEQLQPLYREAAGIDLSPGMLVVARHRLARTLLEQADARSIPFPPRRFDVVISTRVLSHLPNVEPAIREMRRVLAPGGLLLLSDVDAGHDYMHTRLPVEGRNIPADTFKHERERLFTTIEKAGFVPDSACLIQIDGDVRPLGRRRSAQGVPPVAGWIGAWRRAMNDGDIGESPRPWR
nr:class I SAM-dependent methyltransferase [Sphingomonas sp. dw_22]